LIFIKYLERNSIIVVYYYCVSGKIKVDWMMGEEIVLILVDGAFR
jgi:hypothetical protein